MILQPIAMITQTDSAIYAPSRLRGPRTVSPAEFLRLADTAQAVLVSLAPDGLSNPQPVTAYGAGMGGWWIVAG